MRFTRYLSIVFVWLLFSCGNHFKEQSKINLERLYADDFLPEVMFQPTYLYLATGTWESHNNYGTRHPWPFKILSIGHTIESYQNYGGGPYFHHGIDPRGDAGTTVVAAAGGKVVNIENYGGDDAYWEVAILDDEGFLWQYHHIEHTSIPEAINQAFSNGTKISSGTKIGEIFHWMEESFGETFNHIHLNVLGKNSIYLNPLAFLEPLNDTQKPEIVEIGFLKGNDSGDSDVDNNENDNDGGKENVISGDYGLYARVQDLILHQKFILPPYHISYSLDGGKPVTVWQFDNLPGGSSSGQYVDKYFVPGKTCGDYDCRKFTIDLGFKKEGNQYFTKTPGVHKIVVKAADFAGNKTEKEFSWTVK